MRAQATEIPSLSIFVIHPGTGVSRATLRKTADMPAPESIPTFISFKCGDCLICDCE